MKYIIENIANNWRLDAIQENPKYFFHYKEVSSIRGGRKCYVIGRKGSGKSAICQYIVNEIAYNTFSTKLTFKNFPFNELYSLEDNNYARPNQYITLWKFLIYATICKLMKKNGNINSQIREQLSHAFPDEKVERLNEEVKRLVSPEFKLNLGVLNAGASMETLRVKTESSWIDKVAILENFLIEHCDNSNYYIVFDELDEDYKTVKDTGKLDTGYIPLLTGLLKAVQNIKSIFQSSRFCIKPIVFLRSDIYELIKDADKNKWSDYKIDIDWDKDRLKEMLAYRISQDCHEQLVKKDFNTLWFKVFDSNNQIHYGNAKNKTSDYFDFMINRTMLRPRDMICYVRSCCEMAHLQGKNVIDSIIIGHQDRAFSNYLKAEISDEIYPVIPDIDAIFNVLSSIRKQIIRTSEFEEEYKKYVERNRIREKDIDFVLETLFNYSVIGNQHRTIDHFFFFKYQQTNMTYNRNENIVIHRGLLKALQIL